MKLILCENHHYYNNQLYDKCPVCFPEVKDLNYRKEEKQEIFLNQIDLPSYDESEDFGDLLVFNQAEEVGTPDEPLDAEIEPIQSDDYQVKEEIIDEESVEEEQKDISNEEVNSDEILAEDMIEEDSSDDEIDEEPTEVEFADDIIREIPLENSVDVSPSIQSNILDVDGNININQDEQLPEEIVEEELEKENISIISKDINDNESEEEPYVVGWLVGLNHSIKGKSFPLYTGQNFIGRSQSSDIALINERSVAKNKHAIIIFEPRKKQFITIPGESRSLVYVNDEVVLSQVLLHKNDQINLGEVDLMFIPLVDDQFNWDNEV